MTAKQLLLKREQLQLDLDQLEQELESNFITGALVLINQELAILISDDSEKYIIVGKQGEIIERGTGSLEQFITGCSADFEVINPTFLSDAIDDHEKRNSVIS